MRLIRSGSLAALLVALGAVTSSAQTIAGRVLDLATRRAVFPATVRVLGDSGQVLVTAETDTTGVFYADLAHGSHVRLRFDAGGQSTESDTMTVGDTAFVQREFLVTFMTVYTEVEVDKEVAQVPGKGFLQYPEALKRERISGEVLAQFIVDTTGLARASSFRVLRSTHPLFAEAVRRALPGFRFYPAELRGQKVAQLVQQPFTFMISQGPMPDSYPANMPPGSPGSRPDDDGVVPSCGADPR